MHIFLNFSLFLLHLTLCQSANILVVTFLASKSQNLVIKPLLTELADRGHTVTIISPHNYSHPRISAINGDYLQGGVPNLFKIRENFKKEYNLFPYWNPFALGGLFEDNCRSYYENPEVVKILRERRNDFDLIFTQSIFGECGYGLVSAINAPSILVCPVGGDPWTFGGFGAPSLPSFNPFIFTQLSDEMTYFQRLTNVFVHTYFHIYYHWIYTPKMEKIYKDYLPNTPSVDQISRNFSLLFLDTHLSTHYSRPLMQDMIQIGGMSLTRASPLPKNLEQFIGDSGFIYFSLGSLIPTQSLPERVRKIFVNVFAKLGVKVLWKWDSKAGMEDLPPNVFLSDWFAQQDILGHPKLKLFITHGGLGSVKEASYHGAPLLGIPVFADQDTNMAHVEHIGLGKTLEYTEISEELLYTLIMEIIDDKRFMENAQRISKIFTDQSETPLGKAVYWSEYVIRHKGASHLRSPARDLSILQYYSVDTFGSLALIALFFIYLSFKLIKTVFYFIINGIFAWTKPANIKIKSS